MTDYQLPDDFAHWPQDPYQLLGINAGVDERALKRAYAKLIRKFKPEHYPREFARIRAAFEQIQDHLEMMARWRSRDIEEPDDEPANTDDEQDQDETPERTPSSSTVNPPLIPHSDWSPASQSPDNEPPPTEELPIFETLNTNPSRGSHESRRRFDNPIEAAWQTVLQGNTDDGYLQLLSLAKNPASPPEIFLRLYWIQRLFPDLGPPHPSYWLILALRKSALKGPAWELYCADLKRHPHLVTQDDHRSLLDCGAAPERLFDLLEHRWRAALRLTSFQHDPWKLICQDLDLVRDQVQHHSIETWARILFRAIDLAAWSSDAYAHEIVMRCQKELAKLSELHFRLNREFERHDHVLAMWGQTPLDQINQVSSDFAQLTRDMWTESWDDIEPRIKSLLETWVADPAGTLEMLTVLKKRASVAFYHVCEMLRYLDRDETGHDSPDRVAWIRNAFQLNMSRLRYISYHRFRNDLLVFCIHHGIDLPQFRIVFADDLNNKISSEKRDAIQNDLPLEILVHGILAFWN